MLIRKARQEDLPQLLEIYNHEITHGVATFDLEPLTLKERQAWFDSHQDERHPLLVAEEDGAAGRDGADRRRRAGLVEAEAGNRAAERADGLARERHLAVHEAPREVGLG